MTLEEAALDLKNWINQYAPIHRPNGMVGIATDKIIVYMHCPKKKWLSSTPSTFGGWPVEWQWKVGRPIAAAA